jgi:hypothetical protein
MVSSPRSFIEQQGTAQVATATGRTPEYVRVWKCRDYFPRTVWPELQKAYPDTLTVDVLQRFERAYLTRRRRRAA